MIFNPYIIILSFFILAGLFATIWGWRIITEAKKNLVWPTTPGTISKLQASSQADDLLPLIEFSYSVNEKEYQRTLSFPNSVSPSQELTKQYLKKYPLGSSVEVSYDPEFPEDATIEPGLANGDWFVFAIGIITTFFGFIFLLTNL